MIKLADIEQPHNLEAERALLGSLILDSILLPSISSYISRNSFYNTTHQYIYEAIDTLFKDLAPIDTISIMNKLSKLNHEVMLSYVANLPDTVPLSSNIDYYAGIVKEYSDKRSIMRTAIELLNMASTPSTTVDEILSSGHSSLEEIGRVNGSEPDFIEYNQIIDDTLTDIEDRARLVKEGQAPGLESGLPTLDKLTGGINKGNLVILAGETSMGKSALTRQIARHNAKAGRKGVWFSYEMTDIEMGMRDIAAYSDISVLDMENGVITEDNANVYMRIANSLKDSMLLHPNPKKGMRITPEILINMVKNYNYANFESPIEIIYIDYLQIMPMNRLRDEQEAFTLSRATRLLKEFARVEGLRIILLSQFARTDRVPGQKVKPPTINMLKGSSSIEQDADKIWMIHGQTIKEPGWEQAKVTDLEIIIGKGRNAARARSIPLCDLDSTMVFRERNWLNNTNEFDNYGE